MQLNRMRSIFKMSEETAEQISSQKDFEKIKKGL